MIASDDSDLRMTYAEILIKKGKRGAAAFVQAECMSAKTGATTSGHSPEVLQTPAHLQALMDHLLHPEKDLDDSETVDWCRWLVGGGRTPDDFSHNVQEYNNTVMCGLVWTANFVAFRCQTCRISQCMSLCAECFRHGNHEGHDYNMFRSQAGGACDCGDPSVMRESGFCSRVSQSLLYESPSDHSLSAARTQRSQETAGGSSRADVRGREHAAQDDPQTHPAPP